MKSRLLAGSAAAVLALVGVILVFSYAQGADQRAVQNLAPVDVLVVKTAIPAGTSVDAMKDSLVTQQLPGSAVPKTALHTLADAAGKVAAVDLVPGETLVAERLVAPDALKSPGDVKVPAGLQEVSFQLEPQRVVGGRLVPGDHVGIFISMSSGGSDSKSDKGTTATDHPQGSADRGAARSPSDRKCAADAGSRVWCRCQPGRYEPSHRFPLAHRCGQ